MAAAPYVNIARLIAAIQSGGKYNQGRLIATLMQLQQQQGNTGGVPAAPAGGGIPPTNAAPSSGSNSFMNYFYPVTDILGTAASIGGRIANAVYKSKAAKQIARGNAAQHVAASLSTPQSQQTFGNPLGEIAKISADAGQAAATKSLAKGEAWQGSLQDISNFISTINTMRRLMSGNALTAYGIMGMQRLLNGQQRGTP